ncbi:MAG: alpha-amylase family glycosyl hydrolase [Thermoplasmatota archaeon]
MDGATWFKNAIIYHILIDRFAGFTDEKNWQKPEFIGGTIQGITNKIPYLKDLGVTTLWISPFYQTSAYHGYHITDFYSVDTRFGEKKDIEVLIRKLHENNMTIIADFVPNHCSKHHPFFKQAQSNKDSEFYDWFLFTKWPDAYQCFLSINDLPKINLNNQKAKNHITNAAKYWLNLGFDGFRLDHVIGPSFHFWKEFNRDIKSEFPNAVLIGEAWMKGIKAYELSTIQIKHPFLVWLFSRFTSDNLQKQYNSVLDGVLDFTFQEYIRRYCIESQYSEKKLKRKLKRHYHRFEENFYLPTFLDNHDMDRILFSCNNNKEKLKQAISIQFSQHQPAIIYYGDEIGMTQEKSVWSQSSHGDVQARQPMQWNAINIDILSYYKRVIANKKSNQVTN